MKTNKIFLIIVGGLVLALLGGGHRYYYFVSEDQQCQALTAQYAHQLCTPEGQKGDWTQPGLVVVKIPPANAASDAYLLKKEISDVSWVKNPGWFGFKYNCILDRVVLVQGERCQFL